MDVTGDLIYVCIDHDHRRILKYENHTLKLQ